MSPETEKLLADLRNPATANRHSVIHQFADPRYHEAIPVLIDWLEENTSLLLHDYDTYAIGDAAADALWAIGEPAVPYLVAHLEANPHIANPRLIRALHSANHLPNMLPFVAYYRYFLTRYPHFAESVRKLIEKHAPDTVLVTDDMLPDLIDTISINSYIDTEILYQLGKIGDSSSVHYLLDYLRAREQKPRSRVIEERKLRQEYNWIIFRVIRQIGTPLQIIQAAFLLWRDIVENATYALGCIALLALPFVLIAIVWAVFGWIWGLMCIAVPLVGLAVLNIREKRKNRRRFVPRK